MAPPFRADQIGSLLRPQALLDARAHISSSAQTYDQHTDASIKIAEENAINYAVQKQVEFSIRPICSGEYNRHIFYGGFFEALEGMTPMAELPIPEAFRTDFPTTTGLAKMGAKTRAAVVCTGPIHWKESAYLSEWKMLRSTLPEDRWGECKITMPSPSYQHIQLKPGTAYTENSGYASDCQYFADLAKAYSAELYALHREGVKHVTIDDPHLTYFCSDQFLRGCQKDGTDTAALLDLYLEAHNMFLRSKPSGLQMAVHLCRGNMSGSTHWVTGSYEMIAKKLFNETDYDTFYLEFDDLDRTGGFEPLRFLPKGKNVVLGLISTKKAELEEAGRIKERIHEATEVISKSQNVSYAEAHACLALSPQCGFASISLAGGKGMTMERMWEKLALVRDIAKEAWTDA